jgi:uncharacterized protein (TIGR03083 family)
MTSSIAGTEPILCAHLLRKVDAKLLDLLRSLADEEWDLPTVAPGWTIRDVAAHLLDTPLRKLSLVRDRCSVATAPVRTDQELIELVNRLNHEGVRVYRRLSPELLIQLLEVACLQSADFHESLDPFAPAAFNVSWAGETTSLNWFDTARELTERWHHQQQIRWASNRAGLLTPELYHPVLDCFVRGLPFAMRKAGAGPGSALILEIAGDCGGLWALLKAESGWRFSALPGVEADAHVTIPQEIAWRIFTKGISRDRAREQIQIDGDRTLGEQVLKLTSIVG